MSKPLKPDLRISTASEETEPKPKRFKSNQDQIPVSPAESALLRGQNAGAKKKKKAPQRGKGGTTVDDKSQEDRIFGRVSIQLDDNPSQQGRASLTSPPSSNSPFPKSRAPTEKGVTKAVAVASGAPDSLFSPIPSDANYAVVLPYEKEKDLQVQTVPQRGRAVVGERVKVTAPDENSKPTVYDARVLQKQKGLYKVLYDIDTTWDWIKNDQINRHIPGSIAGSPRKTPKISPKLIGKKKAAPVDNDGFSIGDAITKDASRELASKVEIQIPSWGEKHPQRMTSPAQREAQARWREADGVLSRVRASHKVASVVPPKDWPNRCTVWKGGQDVIPKATATIEDQPPTMGLNQKEIERIRADLPKREKKVENALAQSHCGVKIMWVLARRSEKTAGLDQLSKDELMTKVEALERQMNCLQPETAEAVTHLEVTRKTRSKGPTEEFSGVLEFSDSSDVEDDEEDDEKEEEKVEALSDDNEQEQQETTRRREKSASPPVQASTLKSPVTPARRETSQREKRVKTHQDKLLTENTLKSVATGKVLKKSCGRLHHKPGCMCHLRNARGQGP